MCVTEPFEHWFYIHEWAPLIIFFGTYLGIVRNKKIPHVARYHIMMGVMLVSAGHAKLAASLLCAVDRSVRCLPERDSDCCHAVCDELSRCMLWCACRVSGSLSYHADASSAECTVFHHQPNVWCFILLCPIASFESATQLIQAFHVPWVHMI